MLYLSLEPKYIICIFHSLRSILSSRVPPPVLELLWRDHIRKSDGCMHWHKHWNHN